MIIIARARADFCQVLKGELRETRYTIHPEGDEARSGGFDSLEGTIKEGIEGTSRSGNLVEASSLTLASGGVAYIEDSMGYHKMENPSPTEECISLHLYSPGITECNIWADDMYSRRCVGD